MSNDLLRRLDECSVSRHQSRKVNETCLEAAARIRELEGEVYFHGNRVREQEAERDALRALLRDIRPYVYGIDNIKRIDAILEEPK